MEFSIGVEVCYLFYFVFFLFSLFFYGFGHRGRISPKKSQIYSTILHIKIEKYRSDLALTLSLYLYGGLFLIYILNTGLPICMVEVYARAHHTEGMMCIYQRRYVYL